MKIQQTGLHTSPLSILGGMKREHLESSVIYRTKLCWMKGNDHAHKGTGPEGDIHHYTREAWKELKDAAISFLSIDPKGTYDHLKNCNEKINKRDDAMHERERQSKKEQAREAIREADREFFAEQEASGAYDRSSRD
jgi:hypothetical protein